MFTPESRAAVLDYIRTDKNYMRYGAAGKAAAPAAKAAMAARAAASMAATAEAPEKEEEGEIKKYFTLNQTGNIMISSTVEKEESITPAVREAFEHVIVFFGAWTSALARLGKTIYDADAITRMIENSGFFVRLHQEERAFAYTSAMGTLDLAIIGSVLSGFSAMGGALKIAQTVVGAMGSQLTVAASHKEADKKIGHLLFVCENLMGMPIITVSLLNTTSKESEMITKSNCHTTVQQNLNMTYRQDTFLFVDPEYISKFTKDFATNPEYEALIKRLVDSIE